MLTTEQFFQALLPTFQNNPLSLLSFFFENKQSLQKAEFLTKCASLNLFQKDQILYIYSKIDVTFSSKIEKSQIEGLFGIQSQNLARQSFTSNNTQGFVQNSPTFQQNPGNFQQNPGNFQQNPGNFQQNPMNYQQNPSNSQLTTSNFQQSQPGFMQPQLGFIQSPYQSQAPFQQNIPQNLAFSNDQLLQTQYVNAMGELKNPSGFSSFSMIFA